MDYNFIPILFGCIFGWCGAMLWFLLCVFPKLKQFDKEFKDLREENRLLKVYFLNGCGKDG